MKKIILYLILFSCVCFAQENFWEQTSGPTNAYIRALEINSNGDIFAGTDRGVFRSTDNGDHWENISDTNTIILAINNDDDLFIVSNKGRINRSTNNGKNWTSVNNGIHIKTPISSLAIDSFSGELWAGSTYYTYDFANDTISGSGFYISTDNGDSWQGGTDYSDYYYSVGFIKNNKGLIIAQIFVAELAGDPGHLEYFGYQSNLLEQISLSFLIFDSIYTYAGVSGAYLLQSIDDGSNWKDINYGLPDYTSVRDFTFNSNDCVFAATNDSGVYKSVNHGENWEVINSGLTNLKISCLVLDSSGTLFAGTSGGGIFRSVNPTVIPVELISFDGSGLNNSVKLEWSAATETNNKGFEIERSLSVKNTDWQSIGFIEGNGTTTDKKLYSFIDNSVSNGAYLYRLKQIDFDGSFYYSNVIEINFNAPLEFSISQNYPNPFNPSTEIKYSIPASLAKGIHSENPSKGGTLVQLKVYGILGKQVAILVNENKQPGNYEVEFNASSFVSGIYFYTLTAGNYRQTKKMVLLK